MKHIFAFLIGTELLSVWAMGQAGPTPVPAPPPADVANVTRQVTGGPVVSVFFGGAGAFQQTLKPVVNLPYQAQTTSETTQHLADGNVIQNTQASKVARDSKGRTWTEQTIEKMGPWSSDSGPHTVVFISDPVGQVSYVLHPETKTAEKLPFMKPPPGKGVESGASLNVVARGDTIAAPAPEGVAISNVFAAKGGPQEPGDAQVDNLGTQQINGVAAQGKRTTVTIPANTFGNQLPIVTVIESWYSPDLQIVVQSKRDDPRFGESTFSLNNIQKGEPPADLFQVPNDYTISSGPRDRAIQIGPQ